jgi:two-component system response regulator (stage 0 sporulation protein F)
VHILFVAMAQRTRVLIVEDDPDIRIGLEQLFLNEGYAVTLANNGAEAIELLDPDEPPCAALVDLLMPGIVGHELLEYMRAHEVFRSVPIAIISGSPQLAPEGYEVFPKPLEVQRLLDFVRVCPRSVTAEDHAAPRAAR